MDGLKICVAVSCHKRVDFTRRCVPMAIDHAGRPAEWLLMDDGSNDGTAEHLERQTQKLGVTARIYTESRGHYVRRNEGYEWAIERNADVVVNLDNDILCPPNWLRDFAIPFAACDYGVGSAWVVPDYTLVKMMTKAEGSEMSKLPRRAWINTEGCGGACVAHKRAVLAQGLRYREAHPLFCHGDSDFNGQCMRAGWKVGVYTGVIVWHLQRFIWPERDYEVDKLKNRNMNEHGDETSLARGLTFAENELIAGAVRS